MTAPDDTLAGLVADLLDLAVDEVAEARRERIAARADWHAAKQATFAPHRLDDMAMLRRAR